MSDGPFDGVGAVAGPAPPRWPSSFFTLVCDRCSASWIGPDGEPCDWCRKAREWIVDDQRRLLLHPELPDVDDAARGPAVEAWAERLARAVDAGIVGDVEARRAVHRVDAA